MCIRDRLGVFGYGMRAKFEVFTEGIEERSSVAKCLVKAARSMPDEDAGH